MCDNEFVCFDKFVLFSFYVLAVHRVGHGGAEAATFAKEHLINLIVNQKLFWSNDDRDVLRAIREGYIATHYAMWREQGKIPFHLVFPLEIILFLLNALHNDSTKIIMVVKLSSMASPEVRIDLKMHFKSLSARVS